MKVKICGITTFEDAVAATEYGADMLGFNFFARSKRVIEPAQAAQICDALRDRFADKCPILVGLFVNDAVGRISTISEKVGLDCAQLSGDESQNMLIELRGIAFKSIRPMNVAQAVDDAQYYAESFPKNERYPSLIVDAYHPEQYGGTGQLIDAEIVTSLRDHVPRLMLAGGLTPDNVTGRIQQLQPWGVDVASGVESGQPGIKDHDKMRQFIEQAKTAL